MQVKRRKMMSEFMTGRIEACERIPQNDIPLLIDRNTRANALEHLQVFLKSDDRESVYEVYQY